MNDSRAAPPKACLAMREYVADQEAGAPLVFAGRDAVLADLWAGARATAKDRNPPRMTRVVQGIPGAGKTSACAEFIARRNGEIIPASPPDVSAQVVSKPRMALCLEMPVSAMNQPPRDFVVTLHERLRRMQRAGETACAGWSRFRWRINDAGDHFLTAIRKLDAGHDKIARMRGLKDSSPLDQCLAAYDDEGWSEDFVMVLCFDEAQDCEPSQHARNIARELHNNTHTARIIPMFFGLPNTREHLADRRKGLGLSRVNVDCVHNIGALAPHESREVVQGTMDALGASWESAEWRKHCGSVGFTPMQWEDWRERAAAAILEGACDFPQHITLGLRAFCRAMIARNGGFAPADADDAMKEIREDHDRAKVEYYRERTAGLDEFAAAFGAVCRKATASPAGAVTMESALRAISAGADANEPPTAAQARTILNLAISKGALTKCLGGRIAPPSIPSMSSHLDGLLQESLLLEEPHAVRVAQAMGLNDAIPERDEAHDSKADDG